MRHRVAHIEFPSVVPGFERGAITRFDEGGLDLGVEYSGANALAGLTATVYVYPASSGLQAEFDRACADVARRNPGAGEPHRSVEALNGTTLHCATFQLPNARAVAPSVALSLLGLLESDAWFVKYRLTDYVGRCREDVVGAFHSLAAAVGLPATSQTVALRYSLAVAACVKAMDALVGWQATTDPPVGGAARRGAFELSAGNVLEATEACMDEEELGTEHSRTLAEALRAYCPERLRFVGGWGATPQTAIHIEGARTLGQHASALHHLLSFLLGARGTEWVLQAISFAAFSGRYFDRVHVRLHPAEEQVTLFVRAFETEPLLSVDGVLGTLITNGGPVGTLSLSSELSAAPELTLLHLMNHQAQVLIHDGDSERSNRLA